MAAPHSDVDVLNSDQRRALLDYAGRLEKHLRGSGTFADPDAFLPPPGAPTRRAVLHALMKLELEVRANCGKPGRLEEFLRRYPDLGGPGELPPGLLLEEYRLRRRAGEEPNLDEYRTRFPQLFEAFQRLVLAEPAAPPTAYHTLHPSGSSTDPASPETLFTVPSVPPSLPPAPVPTVAHAAAPPPSSSELLPAGEGYQLLECIGRGQFGEVYRARAPGGVLVAVKRITRSVNDECSQRELKALERLRELRHPFLLQTHNYYSWGDRLIIVMELADGSLQDRLEECRAAGQPGVPLEELLRFFGEAAEALDFLHGQKLCHRDIKPQNLLTVQGHAKVADFGIARSQENAVDHTMNVGGTPAYMPPELWRGDVSPQSDQYSFALTWYEMRTGRRAFSGKNNMLDIAQQHLNDRPDLSGVPAAEQKVLLRALAKKPEQRFPSCVAFVQALAAATAPPRPKPEGAGGRGARIAVASFGLALAALAIALWLIVGKPTPPTAPAAAQTPPVQVDFKRKGWEPDGTPEVVEDFDGRRFYRRLARTLGDQKVVMVLVPKAGPQDPRTFYVMENKVWNALYGAFKEDRQSAALLKKYKERDGCDRLVKEDDRWKKGARVTDGSGGLRDLGVGPGRERVPVFNVTATEGVCVAEWMGGRLPSFRQYVKAAGLNDEPPPPALQGGPEGLALGLAKEGPWTVDQGGRDVHPQYGCRQLVSNGQEFTRTLHDIQPSGQRELPLLEMHAERMVRKVGQSYRDVARPTAAEVLEKLRRPDSIKCSETSPEVSFRVVLDEEP